MDHKLWVSRTRERSEFMNLGNLKVCKKPSKVRSYKKLGGNNKVLAWAHFDDKDTREPGSID